MDLSKEPPDDHEGRRLLEIPKLWVGSIKEVRPGPYAASGMSLMAFKYAAEAAVIYHFTGKFFSPWTFLNPLLSTRMEVLQGGPSWLGWAQLVWTLPVLWVALSMSVRRAANAGLSPWLGLVVLVPLLNCLLMLALCFAPQAPRVTWAERQSPTAPKTQETSAFRAILASVLIGLAMVGIGVYATKTYGASLFLGLPIVLGAVSGYFYNLPYSRSLSSTVGVACLSIILPGLVLLLFALEGVVCLAMALPIALPMAFLGGCMGKAIAEATRRPLTDVVATVLILPLLTGIESLHKPTPLREVMTSIEVDAPSEEVWWHVVSFPSLSERPEWYFQLGMAYPKGARMDGTGVGAVRHCDFSTGSFTEPITAWDEPRKLAFDVLDQPAPMFELSPYGRIHPPHLDGTLRSRRGEFLLVPLTGGRTRLEGRTWYELAMYPQGYWLLWSDAVIHRIHARVLRHIKGLAEKEV